MLPASKKKDFTSGKVEVENARVSYTTRPGPSMLGLFLSTIPVLV